MEKWVGILNTFAGEYRDSVRFDYRVLDEEGDPVVLVFEYSLHYYQDGTLHLITHLYLHQKAQS